MTADSLRKELSKGWAMLVFQYIERFFAQPGRGAFFMPYSLICTAERKTTKNGRA